MAYQLWTYIVPLMLALHTAQCYKIRVAQQLPHNCYNNARHTVAPTLSRWPAGKPYSRNFHDNVPQEFYLFSDAELPADWDNDSDKYREMGETRLLQLLQDDKLPMMKSAAAEEDGTAQQHDEQLEQLLFEIEEEDDDGERSSKKRPWRKVQRIIRRQLVTVPKRYLKKFLKSVGLKKYLRSSDSSLLALPLLPTRQQSSVRQVGGILMGGRESAPQLQLVAAPSNGRFAEERLLVLRA